MDKPSDISILASIALVNSDMDIPTAGGKLIAAFCLLVIQQGVPNIEERAAIRERIAQGIGDKIRAFPLGKE